MNAFRLSRVLLLCGIAALSPFSTALCAADEGKAALTITATLPDGAVVAAGGSVKIFLTVKNTANAPWKFQTMSCSWIDEWKSGNPRIGIGGWDCAKNVPYTIELPPGASFTDQIILFVSKPVAGEKISFRLGFTAGANAAPVWSNEVKIEISPADPQKTGDPKLAEIKQSMFSPGKRTPDEHCKVDER